MMRRIVIVCLVTAVFLNSMAFILANDWIGLLLCIVIGGIWLIGVWYGRSWLATLAFVGLILVTAVAGVMGVSSVLLLTSVALALFAWSMANVDQQLTAVSEIRDERQLIKKHMQVAGGIIGLGWLLGLVALNVQFSLNFGWTLTLGFVVVFALSRFVHHLQKEPTE